MGTKVTPAIEKFIQSNSNLTPGALSGLIFKKFKINITVQALYPHVYKARAEKAASNEAKIEAVREKILESGSLQAEKYLKYLDENVESLNRLLNNAKGIKIESVKDYVSASQALLKSLSTILDFVKPIEKLNIININKDLSNLSEEELEVYGQLAAKLDGIQKGEGKTAST